MVVELTKIGAFVGQKQRIWEFCALCGKAELRSANDLMSRFGADKTLLHIQDKISCDRCKKWGGIRLIPEAVPRMNKLAYRATAKPDPGWKERHLNDWLISPLVRVECNKCGRSARYKLEALVAQYGWKKSTTEWGRELTRDCPLRNHHDPAQRCHGPGFPDLLDITMLEEWRRRGRPIDG